MSAALVLQRGPLTQQPQQLPPLDTGNLLTAGAFVFPLAVANIGLGAAAGMAPSIKGGTASSVSKTGRVYQTSSAGADYITLGANGAMYTGNPFTMLAVVEFDSTSGTATIAESYINGSTSSGSAQFRMEAGGNLGLIKDSVVNLATTPAQVMYAGRIHTVAVAYDPAGSIRFAADGVVVMDGSASAQSTNSGSFYLMTKDASTSNEKGAGRIGLFVFWPRKLSAAELATVTANPWQLFAPPRRRLWLAVSGGSLTYSYSAAGGIVYGGTGTELRTTIKTASGGALFSGTAAEVKGRVPSIPTGGIVTGGAAANTKGAARTATGGAVLSGIGAVIKGALRSSSGGVSLAGAAGVQETTSFQSRIVTGLGGIVLNGIAGAKKQIVTIAAGGVIYAGSATLSFNSSSKRAILTKLNIRLAQITDAQVGTGKHPVVIYNARIRTQQTTEGESLVVQNGKVRPLAPGETLKL